MKPSITYGLGALTPQTWGELVSLVDAAKRTDIKNGTGKGRLAQPRLITAQITSADIQVGGTAKWNYGWKQVERNLLVWQDKPEGLTSATTGCSKALNMLEGANTSTLAYGFIVAALSLTDYPNYQILPVPNLTVVHLWMLRDATDAISFEFSAPNPIGGECS